MKSIPPHSSADTRPIYLAAVLIVLATLLAYANSFSGALVYDDRAALSENATIRQLWPLGPVFNPPAEAGTGGRPVANFTFAVSYALSGLQPWGHHVLNLTIHTLAALTLFGVVRRTLCQPLLRARFAAEAMPLATAIVLLWAVHPVQTQTVTYISQRTESLMALFYLLTVYCFIRSTEARSRLWQPLAVAACLLGVLSKEIIATVPLLVLLYDRTFVAGSFAAALRTRTRFYASLAATWILLAWLLIGVRDRGVGYGLGIPWFDYALTECKAVVLYLSLGLWPHQLIFDRGVTLLTSVTEAAPYALVLFTLLAATTWAVVRRPVLGFAGAWFFVILAPASSVIPVIQQPIAENRPYLPLAAVLALAVLALRFFTTRRTALFTCALLSVACIAATIRRNRDYQSEVSIWSDTTLKAPLNARAHYNLGVALDYLGHRAEAIAHYRNALQLSPAYPEANNNLGNALSESGQPAEGLPYLEAAVRLRPTYADAHYNLGNALMRTNRIAEAIPHYEITLRLDPAQRGALNNLGICFLQTGRPTEAIREFERATRLHPDFYDARINLAVALAQLGRNPEALPHAELALRLRPDSADALNIVGTLQKLAAPSAQAR